MNYSTVFLILLTLGCGMYALKVVWRAHSAHSLDYLRFFFFRLAADFTLTMTLSTLYLVGMPLYSVDEWSHGSALLALVFVIGIVCIFVATDSQVATVLSLFSIERRRWVTLFYGGFLLAVAVLVGFAASIGLPLLMVADRGMLVFAIVSRFVALSASAILVAGHQPRGRKIARRAIIYAGGFFILIDGSWLALYALGVMGLLPARLYDGLHLTRLLLLSAVVVIYLGRFLDAFEMARTSTGKLGKLDPHLIKKYGISKREKEIVEQLCQGRSNEQIAGRLFISTRTVKGHLYRIFQKTSVKNRVQLVNLFGHRDSASGHSNGSEK